jgi:predicted dienelactone hydrolase
MLGDDVKDSNEGAENRAGGAYDPFVRGRFPVGVRTFEALDALRNRLFPCEIWYPAAAQHMGQDLAPETQDVFTVPARDESLRQSAVRNAAAAPESWPLILFSHSSGGHRRSSTFLCTHLSSHGYVVAALDHSEIVAPDLARRDGETAAQRAARVEAVIASRVPDIRFLLDRLLANREAPVDPARIGIVGHSFGGWTALAATEADPRIRAVVALAPGGSSQPRPGILPVTIAFTWGRDVPTLYLIAENDTVLPLAGMFELFERTPSTKQMVILRRADHAHFVDNIEQVHEAMRTIKVTADMAEMQKQMRPIAELCSEEQAHLFVRGLALSHLDATLKRRAEARQFLLGDVEAALAERGVEAIVPQP